MLVLTRKLMEKLFIGDDICVTVVRLEAGQVRLGIEAPTGGVRRQGRAGPGPALSRPPFRQRPSRGRADGSQAFTIRGSWKR